MASSLRCSICGECWPPEAAWQKCPQCGEATSPFQEAAPTKTPEEAKSINSHRLFEEYLEKEGKR